MFTGIFIPLSRSRSKLPYTVRTQKSSCQTNCNTTDSKQLRQTWTRAFMLIEFGHVELPQSATRPKPMLKRHMATFQLLLVKEGLRWPSYALLVFPERACTSVEPVSSVFRNIANKKILLFLPFYVLLNKIIQFKFGNTCLVWI